MKYHKIDFIFIFNENKMYKLNCRGTTIEISEDIKNGSQLFKTYFDKWDNKPLYLEVNVDDIHRAIDYILKFDNKLDERFENVLKYLGVDVNKSKFETMYTDKISHLKVVSKFIAWNDKLKDKHYLLNILDNMKDISEDVSYIKEKYHGFNSFSLIFLIHYKPKNENFSDILNFIMSL